MRGIRTRKERKKELLKQRIIGAGFCLTGLAVGMVEFMLWYLLLIPTALFAFSEAWCLAVIIIGIKVFDAAATELDAYWFEEE